MKIPQHPTPIHVTERSRILDILRGFAILGILLDNVFSFTGYGFYNMAQRQALPTFYADGFLALSELTFVHGKFYSLFSLLFGIGFSITLMRNEQKGLNALKIFYRRILILLAIGLIHLILLWEGDILVLYALLAMLLPLFKNCSDKTLLIWAAALIASPILIDSIKVLLNFHTAGFLQDMAQAIDKKNGLPNDQNFAKYLFTESSGWKEWRNWQASGYIYRYAYILETNRPPKVFGMFLIGLYAGRKMMYADLKQHTDLFRKLRRYGFMIGVPASLAMAYFEIDNIQIPKASGLLDTFFYAISVVPLTLAYVATLCLYRIKSYGRDFLTWLAPVGRMALTNYLMHTMLCITLFYGVGFGAAGSIGPTVFFPIAVTIYLFQIMFSNWWFDYFNFGPVEWVWRRLTYGKQLPFKKQKALKDLNPTTI